MPKSLYYFEKILFALKRLRDCLEIAKVVLEKEILRMKVVVPSGLTEKHIQQITFVFNHYFDPMYKNCQICHQDLFKRLPLEVDCLILKIYMSASSTLGATAGNNEQNCFLFHEAKEICLVFRACKSGEWPCPKLIDFKEHAELYQEVKEKVLAKKWTDIPTKDTNEKL